MDLSKYFSRYFAFGLLALALICNAHGCVHRDGDSGIAGPAVPTPRSVFKFDIQRKRLKNGLEILMVEDHLVPVISYQTWFKVGAVDERPGKTGIAHLFEHLMFKGTPRYGRKQFFEQLETKGAEVNAYTTRDYTVYYENFTPNLLEKVVDMESDRLTNIRFTQADLDTERQVVFEERKLRTENSPSGRMSELLWSLAYERHPYRWPIIGFPEDLLRIKVGDLESFFARFYQPGNATVVVVGDIDPDKTFQLIDKHYGKIKGTPRAPRKITAETKQQGERRHIIKDHVGSQKLMQAYHITAASEVDSYAIDVLANILFFGTSSRAYRMIVEEMDLATDVSGASFTPTYPGLFIISSTLKVGQNGAAVEKALDKVFHDIFENGVTQEEVSVAVRQLIVQMLDSADTPSGLAQLLGTVHTILGDADKYSEDIDKYFKVKPEDVRRVAVKYLDPNNRTVVTMLPDRKE